MIIELQHSAQAYSCDLSKPIDLSIPIGQVRCFYSTEFKATPYDSGDFIGAVTAGAPVNFFDIQFNPHGNGTHTECLGHITIDQEHIGTALKTFHFVARLVSIAITLHDNDQVVSKRAFVEVFPGDLPSAVILRTLPNHDDKLTKDYSGSNPPYISTDLAQYLVEQGVEHLLLDLPSVDREEDDGILAAHHIFWKVDGHKAGPNSRANATITEMIFVSNEIEDGLYLLNLQIPSLPLDAAPSKPVIYKLYEKQ